MQCMRNPSATSDNQMNFGKCLTPRLYKTLYNGHNVWRLFVKPVQLADVSEFLSHTLYQGTVDDFIEATTKGSSNYLLLLIICECTLKFNDEIVKWPLRY